MPTRQEMWERLGEKSLDMVIIGGGIVGSGIARDAARRGLDVAVVEMKDLAWGTSSRSSKLVHGGVRYLEQYQFGLVFESVSERRILMDLAPHLVNPLGFIFPVYGGAKHKRWVLNAGMWIYDGLSLFRSPRMHKNLDPDEVAELEPLIKQENLKGAPLYWDCSTDDARLTLETALDAAASGAIVATWARVDRATRKGGRVSSVRVVDELTGAHKTIHTRLVVNATGPWADETLGVVGAKRHGQLLRPTKGVHLVVDHAKLPLSNAVVCFHPKDQRVLFAIPWGDRTYIGTTDTDFSGDPGDVCATRADVEYLLEATNTAFPRHQLSTDEVIATWAGVRPLVAPPATSEGQTASEVSREHEILVGGDGIITVTGGKLTTYRRMSEEVVDHAVRWLELADRDHQKELEPARTQKDPLPGAVGWPEDDDHDGVAAMVLDTAGGGLAEASARYLVDTYGMRAIDIAARIKADKSLGKPLIAGRPEVVAQIDWAVEEELAASVSDFMIRRTQLFYRDVNQGLMVTALVADRMGALLKWSDEDKSRHTEAYRSDVARSRKWQHE
jgi:glycerol-3-phosphate dehydrogenase